MELHVLIVKVTNTCIVVKGIGVDKGRVAHFNYPNAVYSINESLVLNSHRDLR